ncbi:MAG: hypothetical protein HYS87_00770 [Candidatus Colwellbacteria bacterium]|nr:hypothetical protein [Candidatus Colwellbacteria bacterium]
MANKFIDKRYAKSEYYKEVLTEINESRVCPFCPKHFKWHKKPILRVRGGWIITESMQPYKNSKYHFIMVAPKHKEQFKEVTANDWRYISYLVKWVIKEFSIKGGGFIMRFGDSTHTGATVRHLHAHLIVPKVSRGRAKAVYFPIG